MLILFLDYNSSKAVYQSNSTSQPPRRSLSASHSHQRGVSPIVNPASTSSSLSSSRNRIQSAREKDRITNSNNNNNYNNNQQSNNSSRQSSGRLHSNPSARRQMSELNDEINAVRNL